MAARACLVAFLMVSVAACDSAPYDHHRPFPQVATLDGSLLSPLRLVTIVPENDREDASALFAFSEGVGGSSWWRLVSPEYGLGSVSSAATLLGPPIATNMTDHDLFQYIQGVIATDPGLTPDGHTLYLLYLPPAVEVVTDGVANTDCRGFAAYHARFGIRGDNLAIVQRCNETFPIENMTVSASHELFESATDPDDRGYKLPAIAGQSPWIETIWNAFNLGGGAELADLCEGTFWIEGDSVFQRVWSNAAARKGGDPCLPALPDPYYDTDFAQDWYPISAGGSVTIPVTGWSTGQAEWPLSVSVDSDVSSFAVTLAGDSTTLTPGAKVNLLVASRPEAQSGTFAIIRAASERPLAAQGMRGLTDGAHFNYVGVYVP